MNTSMTKVTKVPNQKLNRVLLHLGDGLREVVDPADVHYLEAQGEDTRVRLIRRRKEGRDWEVKLEPPVN